MRIYLDNCCFNRPFDDQSKIRIKLEADAKLRIQDDILGGKYDLIWSYILEAENMANPFDERKKSISDWKEHAVVTIKEDPAILAKATELNQMGLRSKDALHISCAISAACQYFLTTDDKIINKNKSVKDVIIIDTLGFIKEMYE